MISALQTVGPKRDVRNPIGAPSRVTGECFAGCIEISPQRRNSRKDRIRYLSTQVRCSPAHFELLIPPTTRGDAPLPGRRLRAGGVTVWKLRIPNSAGATQGGHLLEGKVRPMPEVILSDTSVQLERKKTADIGINSNSVRFDVFPRPQVGWARRMHNRLTMGAPAGLLC
jgi:hypothetical protein